MLLLGCLERFDCCLITYYEEIYKFFKFSDINFLNISRFSISKVSINLSILSKNLLTKMFFITNVFLVCKIS